MSTAVVLLFGMAPALAITRGRPHNDVRWILSVCTRPAVGEARKAHYDRASGDLVHAAGGCPVVCAEPAIPRQS